MRRSLLALCLPSLGLFGCVVDVPLPITTGLADPSRAPPFRCDASAPLPEEPMRRLLRVQLENAAQATLEGAVSAERAGEIVAAGVAAASSMPLDKAPPDPDNHFRTLYRRFDRDVGDAHVVGWHDAALAMAERLVVDDRDALLGEGCTAPAAGAATQACLTALFDRLGARALRRPLVDEDRARLAAIYGDTSALDDAALRDIVGVLLAAPEAFYQVESGGPDPVDGAADVYPLTAHELASRLALTLWDGAPDDALRAAADDGSLLDADVLAAQVDRMLDDERAEPVAVRFVEDWLRIDMVPDYTAQLGLPGYALFVGDDAPTPQLREAVRQEIRDLGLYLWRTGAPITDFVTTRKVFPRTDELAHLYGLDQAWDGVSEPPDAADTDRPGVITRVAFVSSGLVRTRPVIKAILLRDQLLCLTLPTPPPGAGQQTVDMPMPYTTRDYLEALTETEGSSCSGCHAQVNAYGYATEMFDGLGRFRTEERIIDLNSGEDFGTLPLRTDGSLLFPRGEARVTDPASLVDEIVRSGQLEACASRQLFRFEMSRMEDTTTDGCMLRAMQVAAEQNGGGSLKDMVRALVLHPSFAQRRIVE